MNLCPLVVLLCSRAVGKSFITALYCCAVCVLYPDSKVVATAKRKKTIELLVKEKIEKELIPKSPNLAREIKKVNTSNNIVEVVFYNGSTFVVCPCNDDARGQRATILIVDEFRQCDEAVLNAVFSPMEIKRQPLYSFKPEYEDLKEEPREIYLSSAYYKSHWMWKLIKDAIIGIYDGSSMCISMDYAISVKHGLRSTEFMKKEKKKMSPIVFDMEYNNLMAGGTDNQFYSFELVSQAQKVKKAWYPMPLEDWASNKKTWFGDIKKQNG